VSLPLLHTGNWGLRDYGTAEWEGGDADCKHRPPGPQNDKAMMPQDGLPDGFRHGKGNTDHANEPYKTICPQCGAIRIDKQLGLEETPEEYIDKMVTIFREVKRVMRDDGTLWLNVGTSYVSSNMNPNQSLLRGHDLSYDKDDKAQSDFQEIDRVCFDSCDEPPNGLQNHHDRKSRNIPQNRQSSLPDEQKGHDNVRRDSIDVGSLQPDVQESTNFSYKQNVQDVSSPEDKASAYPPLHQTSFDDVQEFVHRKAYIDDIIQQWHSLTDRILGIDSSFLAYLYSSIISRGYKVKDLIQQGFLLAEALRLDGWYLRSDIIWSKPNPMPESCTDRPTKSHEYIFLLTKSARYYYDADAVREEYLPSTFARREYPIGHTSGQIGGRQPGKTYHYDVNEQRAPLNPRGRNRRTVWTIPTQPYSEAHFATFPVALVIPCIKAGTSEKGNCSVCGKPWVRVQDKNSGFDENGICRGCGQPISKHIQSKKSNMVTRRGEAVPCGYSVFKGWQPLCDCFVRKNSGFFLQNKIARPIVLDPFIGSGTVAEVCERYGRAWIGIELSQEYCDIAVKRIEKEAKQMKMAF